MNSEFYCVSEPNYYAADKVRDVNSKNIFHDPVLYAQFLRDNVEISVLKNVQPEDIEDVSEKYRPYLGVEFEADTVKKIKLRDAAGEEMDTPLYLISLTEHKSGVDYDVTMQILKYMACIWEVYGQECEKEKPECTRKKSFRYPPIIPIVYYEGKLKWTADLHLRDRVLLKEVFGDWIPDFTYEVVRLHDYENEELLERGDEMSLIMMFNKIQDTVDLAKFLDLPQEKLDQIVKCTPMHIIEIIAAVMKALCVKIGATEEETDQCIQKVRERKMGYLFENMEKMNIQEERKKTAEAQRLLKEAEEKATQMEEKAIQMEEKAIQIMVETCQKFDVTREQTIDQVIDKFGLSKEAATAKVDLYWK